MKKGLFSVILYRYESIWHHMKLVLKSPESFVNERLDISCKDTACLDASWHYHPQYELLYISQSSGIRFVGDSVAHFGPGDLVLVGSNLPHLWRNDADYYAAESTRKVKTIVVKFLKDFIGQGTFQLPEFAAINQMLEESKYGLSFGKNVSRKFHQELMDIVDLPPAEQSIKLLGILQSLSQIKEREVMSSTDMRQYASEPSKRLDAVLKYISDNYASSIQLQDVADIACMTTNSFCRFFKKMTNKSFTQFLSEVRIRNASRLLLEEENSVSQVCYLVGYNSVTNFYRQFKQIMGCTPSLYRQSI